jgi:PAS domain-containing protein
MCSVRAGERLRPEDLGFGRLFEMIRDAVVVADAKTQRIVLWNAAAAKMFGYRPQKPSNCASKSWFPSLSRTPTGQG